MLGCSGLESTRSEGISPQVTHWRLGKSDFTSVGEEDCRPNHNVSEEKFSFFMLIQHTFLNRKYSVDLKSEAYFASFLLWHLCMFSRLIAVIPYIHTCSDSTSNSLLRGYSSFFMYAEHVVSAVYCWINPWVNLLSAPQKNDRRWRRGVSKLPFRSYQRFIWGERH